MALRQAADEVLGAKLHKISPMATAVSGSYHDSFTEDISVYEANKDNENVLYYPRGRMDGPMLKSLRTIKKDGGEVVLDSLNKVQVMKGSDNVGVVVNPRQFECGITAIPELEEMTKKNGITIKTVYFPVKPETTGSDICTVLDWLTTTFLKSCKVIAFGNVNNANSEVRKLIFAFSQTYSKFHYIEEIR